MPRYLLQSATTGRFLCPSNDGGEPEWVASLREAGGGVISDEESIQQLVQDNSEYGEVVIVIDLDRLGTVDDYPVLERSFNSFEN